MILDKKRILLGVSGSISAYKACDLVQRLKDQGAEVRVVMTQSASKLVGEDTFSALCSYPALTNGWKNQTGTGMDHISLARWADIFIIAPATAHILGEMANGLTSSLLSLVYMTWGKPVIVAPAMNTVMLESPAVQRNLRFLEEKGDFVLPTQPGLLACGETGSGKLLEVNEIIELVKIIEEMTPEAIHSAKSSKVAKSKALITTGHTREKIDNIRFISNHSSGKTGLAIARVLWLCGYDVHLALGYMDEEPPSYISATFLSETSAFDAFLEQNCRQYSLIIFAAALADFIPVSPVSGKIKDSKSLQNIELKKSAHVLTKVSGQKLPHQTIIGFALEDKTPISYARDKLKATGCDLMIVNTPLKQSEVSGFGKDSVYAAILKKDDANPSGELQLMSKNRLAWNLIHTVSKKDEF